MPGYVDLHGAPGKTQKMNPGDVVEVEIEGVGILRNRVVSGIGYPNANRLPFPAEFRSRPALSWTRADSALPAT